MFDPTIRLAMNAEECNNALISALQSERAENFGLAHKHYQSVRATLPQLRDGSDLIHNEIAVQAVVGELICEMADLLTHGNLTLRRDEDFNCYILDIKDRLREIAGSGTDDFNFEYYLNSLITAFKRFEQVLSKGGWDSQASPMYFQWKDADRILSWHRVGGLLRNGKLLYAGKELLRGIPLSFLRWTCGYGEKPLQWIAWALSPTLISALLLSQMHWISWNWAAELKPISYFDALYYSIITFLTIGYGEILPNCLAGRIVAMLLGIWGYVMFGLLISMFSRKVIRQ